MLFRRNSWNGTSRAPAAGRCRLALLSACLGAGASLLAQQPPPDTHTLRVDVQLVNVDVTVVDAQGRFVPDLAGRHFRLREDGAPPAGTHFLPPPPAPPCPPPPPPPCFSSATTTWPPRTSCSPGCGRTTRPRSSPTPAPRAPSWASPGTKRRASGNSP